MCMILESTVWPYEQDKVVFYKLFAYCYETQKYNESLCYKFIWHKGINKSSVSNESIKEGILNGRIQEGLHVFIHQEDAIHARDFTFTSGHRLIKVVGRKKDFIGIGRWSDNEKIQQAVFKNLEITLEEWSKLCA